LNSAANLAVRLELACDEAEMDEQWSFVGNKSNQRWLWYAVDHATNTVLAYVFGKRKDEVFKKLKALLEPFGISRYYTDDWGLMSVTLKSTSMRWVSATLKRLNAKI
jgi:insertion element IS1 protein InsB